MTTTVVLNPEQFIHLSPLQIKEIADEIKESPAEPNESLPAETLSNKNEKSQQVNENPIPINTNPESQNTIPNNPQSKQPPLIQNPIEKGHVIDVEGNNARASFHLSILIAFILAMFCLVPLAFIPFSIVYFRFRSNPTESPQVYAFSEKSRWIALGVLFSNLVMLLVAAMIVLIVLFSIGTI